MVLQGITRPNFMNNVDILVLLLIGIFIMCNKSLFTKHCFNIKQTYNVNTAVTCFTHDTDALRLLCVGNEDNHHSILTRKYEQLQRCMQAASLIYQGEADEETESDTEFLPN